MKKASVIITTFKRAQFLSRAIESVLEQDYPNFEIIVVDDNGQGSPDQLASEQVIEKYTQLRGFFYAKLQENSGACKARNEGARKATGVYLFFLDDDDVFFKEKISKQIALLEKNSRYDGCLCALKRMDDNDKEVNAPSNFPIVGNFINFAINGNFFTPMLCIKKTSFEASGGFKEISRFQDRYFMLHCLMQNMKFITTNEPLYIMYEHKERRISSQGIQKTVNSLNQIKDFISFYRIGFTLDSWKQYLGKHYAQIAITYYISPSYKKRINSIFFWGKSIVISRKLAHLKMIFKSLIPNNYKDE